MKFMDFAGFVATAAAAILLSASLLATVVCSQVDHVKNVKTSTWSSFGAADTLLVVYADRKSAQAYIDKAQADLDKNPSRQLCMFRFFVHNVDAPKTTEQRIKNNTVQGADAKDFDAFFFGR
jgi:hypothetical protein